MKKLVQITLGVAAITAMVSLVLHPQVGQDAAINHIAKSGCEQSGLTTKPDSTWGERSGDCLLTYNGVGSLTIHSSNSQFNATFFVPQFTALGTAAVEADCADHLCFVTYDRSLDFKRMTTDRITIHYTGANGDGQLLMVRREGGSSNMTINR